MEKTKICMGCFEELPDDTMVCSICGFDNKTIKREVQKWCQGAVIEKRWLLGCRFSQSDTYTIWRAWDSVLEIKCFLLVLNDDSDMALSDKQDRKSTRLNSSHRSQSRMPSSA